MQTQRNFFLGGLVTLFVGLLAFSASLYPNYAQDTYGTSWSAAYYNNADLSGTPVLTRTETRVDFSFGANSPSAEVQADNFSAAYATTFTFTAGSYEFVAVADEGVRVFLNGATIIDQFSGAAGQTLTSTQELPEGAAQIRVEYREFTGDASIRFFWRASASATPSTAQPTPLPVIPAGAQTATVVRAGVLIVRDAPFLGGNPVGRIRRGETYAVVGRDSDALWFLLDIGGRTGWAWGYYLHVEGNEYNPPVENPFTNFSAPADSASYTVQTISVIKLRAEPNVLSRQIGRVDWGIVLPVLARSDAGLWYQVVWEDTVGWVYTENTVRPFGGDINAVPIVQVGANGIEAAANPPYSIELIPTATTSP
ncbi:MAG: PA14 domain-containing protein [Phototrophicaceae bacterium]